MNIKNTLLALVGMALVPTLHAAPKVGDKAPQVSATLSDGTTFSLPGWLEKAPLVLYFYPKDDTPGCTTEACALRDDISAYRELNATVVGSSYDSIESHRRFIAKYNLPFPLVADTDKKLAKAFGVDGAMFAKRATFIIAKDGTILYANTAVDPKTHSQEIRAALLGK
jgi:peroxiredoxin Q/BCP